MSVSPVARALVAAALAGLVFGGLPGLGDADPWTRPAADTAFATDHAGDPFTVAAIRAQAALGTLTLDLGGAVHTLLLEANPLMAPDARVTENGVPVAPPDIDLYRGHVDGIPGSHVSLAVSGDRADGHVFLGDRTLDIGTHDGTVTLTDVATLARPYGVIDEDPLGADKQGPSGCLGAAPEVGSPITGALGTGSPLTYHIVVVSDKPFTVEHSGWSSEQRAHMNRVSVYYQNNFNIQIQITEQSADTAGTVYTSNDPSVLLTQLRSAWYNAAVERDTVHLLSGRDFTSNTVGQAACIGGAHSPATQYTTTQDKGFSRFWASGITAHELGHMMSAHHHYSNCHDDATIIGTQTCTVMTPAVDFMSNSMAFSTLSKVTIRSYADDVL